MFTGSVQSVNAQRGWLMPYSGTMNNTMKVDTVSGYTMTTNSTLTFTLDPKVTPYIHLTDMMT